MQFRVLTLLGVVNFTCLGPQAQQRIFPASNEKNILQQNQNRELKKVSCALMQTAAPGLEVTDVAIFIDMNREALEHPDI